MFHEIRFPTDISFGSAGGPGHSTAVIETDSGKEQRVSRWSSPRRKYDAAYGVKSQAAIANLITFCIARQGSAFGFRFKDFDDFSTASDHKATPTKDDVNIGTGDGSKTQFQIIKKYDDGLIVRTRNITKPVSGTTKVALNGTNQTSGFSVNTANGIITFTTAPGSGVNVTAGCEYDVPVRFDQSIDEVLAITREDFSISSISISLVEVVDETEIPEEFYYGGAKNHGNISASVTLSLQDGRVQIFSPQITGLAAILPNPATSGMPLGGPLFIIQNTGVQSMSIMDHNSATIKVLAISSTVEIFLGLSGSTKIYLGH